MTLRRHPHMTHPSSFVHTCAGGALVRNNRSSALGPASSLGGVGMHAQGVGRREREESSR